MKPVAVIGLGKFGFYIAKSLAQLGTEVIAGIVTGKQIGRAHV